jgi:dTMP kinase
MFITFEGIDGSGKTTQANLLVERFKEEKHDCIFLREPGGTGISEKIRTLLLDRDHLEMTQLAELFLFSAARTQLVTEVIRPCLDIGKIVVCDRFFDSTTAYQGYGRGIDIEAVRKVNSVASQGTVPDITFILDIELNEIDRRRSPARRAADRMESGGNQLFERVRRGYLEIARMEPRRCIVVNGMRPRQEIHEEIWGKIQPRIEALRGKSQ